MGGERLRVGELIDAHRREREVRGLAEKTREQDEYGYNLLRATGTEHVEELQPEDVYTALCDLMPKKGWKPRTKNICIIQAKSTLTWAVKRNRLDANPWSQVDLFEEDEADRRPLTVEEVQAVCKVSNPYWRLIWLTYIETLCRRDEIRLRLWSEVDLEAGVVKLPGRKHRGSRRVGTKTKRSRECLLGPRLVQRLRALKELDGGTDADPLFPSRMAHLKTADPTRFLSPGIPRTMLQRACRRAGVDTTGVDIHSLRYTGATLLADPLDVPLDIIERMLGHGTVGRQHSLVLRIYVKRRSAAVQDAVEKLDELLFG